ncbi:MAG TPA: hypothetical protein VML92_04935 [Steroidobacteraceae bacterium]|nr:hypothetical protein [Steroidobacteraceae bacterium]
MQAGTEIAGRNLLTSGQRVGGVLVAGGRDLDRDQYQDEQKDLGVPAHIAIVHFGLGASMPARFSIPQLHLYPHAFLNALVLVPGAPAP